jgi:thymidylate synthase ThyX
MYAAKILADSIALGTRLTTLEVTFPRIVLAEFNTHRMLSRNSASSRAIPVEKRIEAVLKSPFVPEAFGANQKGMQAGASLPTDDQFDASQTWLWASRQAVQAAKTLATIGVHKQWANRLLEPFGWHTVIVTATEWENFFALRCSPEAQPEIRRAAELMRDAIAASTPTTKQIGEWHLPLVVDEDLHTFNDSDPACLPRADMVKVSVARCARVSYLTHDGKRDVDADLALYDRLLKSGHMSPFEHAAKAVDHNHFSKIMNSEAGFFCGNFRYPWVQHRKQLADGSEWAECVPREPCKEAKKHVGGG